MGCLIRFSAVKEHWFTRRPTFGCVPTASSLRHSRTPLALEDEQGYPLYASSQR